jgi:hypothetical protein
MKKAQLKKLRELIKTLPQIPLISNGKPVLPLVWVMGHELIEEGVKRDAEGKAIDPKLYYQRGSGQMQFVNKEQFFISTSKQGIPPHKAVDLWNDKYKTVLEIIASAPNDPLPGKSQEEMKQQVAEEHQERENKLQNKGLL